MALPVWFKNSAVGKLGVRKLGGKLGVRESAGINRLGIGNERVLQRRLSQSLWPRTVRW